MFDDIREFFELVKEDPVVRWQLYVVIVNGLLVIVKILKHTHMIDMPDIPTVTPMP